MRRRVGIASGTPSPVEEKSVTSVDRSSRGQASCPHNAAL